MHRLPLIPLFAATAAVAACQQEQPQQPADANASEPVVNLPTVPMPQPPLDRASLLAAVSEAASATASGAEMPETVRSLDGRQFEIRIRFGCRGPSKELGDRWLAWSFDSESRRIRVRAMPTISEDDPLVRRIAGEEFEAVEGFWLARPWLLEAACPATAAVKAAPPQAAARPDEISATAAADAAEPAEAPAPTVVLPKFGIAQFFTENDSRTRQRSMRPYEAAETLKPDTPVGSQGFDLVLSGRLQALPDKRVIACVAKSPDVPPSCIVSARFDRVRIERADNQEIVAQWGSG